MVHHIRKHIRKVETKIDVMSSEEQGDFFSIALAATAFFAIAYKLIS